MPLLHLGSSAWETSNTTGTGVITLNGQRAGYTTFDSSIGQNNYCGYTIRSELANIYEVGIGILTSANTLERTEILHSSNSGLHVDLTSDLHEVVSTLPADILQKLLETHRGNTAPNWFVEGMQWMDDSAYPLITHRIYDTATNTWMAFATSDASTGLPVNIASSQNIVEQASAPVDTQLTWVDSTGSSSTWPVYRFIDTAWRLIGSYESSTGNYYANTVPITLPVASEIVQGIAELATQIEVDAGVDDERFITPMKLRNSIYGTVLPGTIGSTAYDGPVITHDDNSRNFLAYWNGVQYQSADCCTYTFGVGYCGNTQPSGLVSGERWLDTSTTPSVLKEFDGTVFVPILSIGIGNTFYCHTDTDTGASISQEYIFGDLENTSINDWHIPCANGIVARQYGFNGYVVFKDGLILQWGRVGTGTIAANTSAQLPVNLPVAFPNSMLSAQASSSVIEAYVNATVNNFSTTGFNVTIRNLNPGGPTVGNRLTYWWALGF